MVHIDVWYEILLRVDPSFIFNCILISKACLEVITSPEFRQGYQKRWKTNSKLVGFTKHKDEFKLFAASELGRNMNANKSKNLVHDYFISKSGEGDGLILYGSLLQNLLFVSEGDEGPTQLMPPAPPDDYNRWAATAILSGQNDSYKVILAGTYFRKPNLYPIMSLVIQTFSSSSAKWEKSEKPSEITRDCVMFEPTSYIGMANSKRGMVYWLHNSDRRDYFWPERKTVLAISYDVNNGCISNIYAPDVKNVSSCSDVNYGLSSQGYFQCAISGHRIDIWGFFDDVNGEKMWKFLHSVFPNPIPKTCVNFMSFFPGKPDSIVIESGGQLFVYNLRARKNNMVCRSFKGLRLSGVDLVPLTIADLGVWPSSPSTKNVKTNISSIKKMLVRVM